jgi:hypothetical protein
MKLTTDRHLVPRLRTRGVVLPPQYVFRTWCLIKQRISLHGVVIQLFCQPSEVKWQMILRKQENFSLGKVCYLQYIHNVKCSWCWIWSYVLNHISVSFLSLNWVEWTDDFVGWIGRNGKEWGGKWRALKLYFDSFVESVKEVRIFKS